jgi:serine/threonine protein phosphatase PrpC
VGVEDTIRQPAPTLARPAAPTCISASATHAGKIRSVNEDAVLERPEIGLWAVADGVGGAAAGDRASALVVAALSDVPAPATASEFLASVERALDAANHALRVEAQAAGRPMGSTVVVLLVFNGHFACAWAGDSRLYLLRAGELRQVTRDHSAVQQMIDDGTLAPEAAPSHPSSNVITRAIGASDALELDKAHDRLLPGDIFLLCSDGLTKPVAVERIAALLVDRPIEIAAEMLVQEALDRGGPDNVTVCLVEASPREPQP